MPRRRPWPSPPPDRPRRPHAARCRSGSTSRRSGRIRQVGPHGPESIRWRSTAESVYSSRTGCRPRGVMEKRRFRRLIGRAYMTIADANARDLELLRLLNGCRRAPRCIARRSYRIVDGRPLVVDSVEAATRPMPNRELGISALARSRRPPRKNAARRSADYILPRTIEEAVTCRIARS